jgi:hypothetical protein
MFGQDGCKTRLFNLDELVFCIAYGGSNMGKLSAEISLAGEKKNKVRIQANESVLVKTCMVILMIQLLFSLNLIHLFNISQYFL